MPLPWATISTYMLTHNEIAELSLMKPAKCLNFRTSRAQDHVLFLFWQLAHWMSKNAALPQVKLPVQTNVFAQGNSQKSNKSTAAFLNKTNCDWALPPVLSWTELLGCPVIASSQNTLLLELAAVTFTRCAFKTKPDWHITWVLDLVKKILGQGSLFPMPQCW